MHVKQDSLPDEAVGDDTQLKAQIRDNERVWSGFRNIEIGIIGARSLRDLVGLVVNGIRDTFAGVDRVSMACLDPDYSLSRLFSQEAESKPDSDLFVAVSRASLEALFPDFPRPRVGHCSPAIQSLLFASCPYPLGSIALVPLVLRGQLLGALSQASRNPAHYEQTTATDFLEHLAAVTAMCIDNVVNREQLKIDGLTDALTHVANRRFFDRRLNEELTRWRRRGGSLVCMLVDVDHFKKVNDNHGHQAGDKVLAQVAELLGKDLRASDVLARYGGEEFVLLLPETSERQGLAIAERLRQIVERAKFEIDAPESLEVTVSAGLAVLDRRSGRVPQDTDTWILGQADAALYRAKRAGRNKVVMGG